MLRILWKKVVLASAEWLAFRFDDDSIEGCRWFCANLCLEVDMIG